MNYDELILKIEVYLIDKLKFTALAMERCRKIWRRIKIYLDSLGHSRYSQKYQKNLLKYFQINKPREELSQNELIIYNRVIVLNEFLTTGKITVLRCYGKKTFNYSGQMGLMIKNYLEYKLKHERNKSTTVDSHNRYLFRFYEYCLEKKCDSINKLNYELIIGYISNSAKVLDKGSLVTLKQFLYYLFQNKFHEINLSIKIPKFKYQCRPKLASTYTDEDVKKLILSLRRSSKIDKRNYAIILLAARLGLRCSDIAKLKFSNIDWNNSIIQFYQFKTGKEIVLPLIADVGNALLDYIEYARPISDEDFIFLQAKYPYKLPITTSAIGHLVYRAFAGSGVDTKNKKTGPHSLRHSLGFNLLQQKTVLPVITEVLGHKDSQSTQYYIRIDIKSMEECIVEVIPVPTSFYLQKGGVFYG